MAATLHHTAIISHYSKSNLLFRSASHSPAQISLQNGLFSEFSALKFRSRAATSWVLKSRDLRSGAGLRCEAAQQEAVLDAVQNVNDMTWKPLVLDADGPVLVEFYAPWCGPCRMIHPVIDELSKEYAGKIKCYKLSTDESPSIATAYGIRSIPTTLILVNGEKKDLILGAVPKPVLSASIEKYL